VRALTVDYIRSCVSNTQHHIIIISCHIDVVDLKPWTAKDNRQG